MTQLGRHSRPFRVRCTDPVSNPEFNPYLRRYEEFGSPVVLSREAANACGRWGQVFAQEQPVHLEIGSGNGFFLAGIAQVHPEWNVLGVEIRYKRIVTAAKKIRAFGVEDNARITRYDAWWLDEVFAAGELSGIYLNHPDPWPKEKHQRLWAACYAPAAISAILFDLYGLPPAGGGSGGAEAVPVKALQGFSASWTLGAVLFEVLGGEIRHLSARAAAADGD